MHGRARPGGGPRPPAACAQGSDPSRIPEGPPCLVEVWRRHPLDRDRARGLRSDEPVAERGRHGPPTPDPGSGDRGGG